MGAMHPPPGRPPLKPHALAGGRSGAGSRGSEAANRASRALLTLRERRHCALGSHPVAAIDAGDVVEALQP
jgi:hypothetical protein